MPENLFIRLAQQGLRMPIGADLVLHEAADPEGCKYDAERLGAVVASAARRYQTPLAFPLMDLTLEKADLLSHVGVPQAEVDLFHFATPPSLAMVSDVLASAGRAFLPRIQANQGAVRYIAEQTDLLPVGMLIGPFSLMTKLVADPIAGVALAGGGVTALEDEAVCLVERCLALARRTVIRSALAQIHAGARAMILASPLPTPSISHHAKMRAGADILERFVAPNRRIRQILGEHGVDLIFHDCGELNTDMVRQFAEQLRPAVISLGSSRKLWEDAGGGPSRHCPLRQSAH